jgi:hypothetical protein
MSNRNFDSSAIIQRLKDINIAQSIYKANKAGVAILSNPQNSNPSPQVIVDMKEGAETTYTKNLGRGYTINQGGTCS